jgi:hypothetical protein
LGRDPQSILTVSLRFVAHEGIMLRQKAEILLGWEVFYFLVNCYQNHENLRGKER